MKIPLIVIIGVLFWIVRHNQIENSASGRRFDIQFDEKTIEEPAQGKFNFEEHRTKKKINSAANGQNETEQTIWNLYTLGEYYEEDVALANKTIHEVFTFGTRIKGHKEVPANCAHEEILDGNECLSAMYNADERGIFITRQNINYGDLAVRGLTRSYGRVVLLKSNPHFEKTLIHEIGHTYGLEHCNNLACVMAIYNDDEGTKKFCERCAAQIPEGVLRSRKASTLTEEYSKEAKNELNNPETITLAEE